MSCHERQRISCNKVKLVLRTRMSINSEQVIVIRRWIYLGTWFWRSVRKTAVNIANNSILNGEWLLYSKFTATAT